MPPVARRRTSTSALAPPAGRRSAVSCSALPGARRPRACRRSPVPGLRLRRVRSTVASASWSARRRVSSSSACCSCASLRLSGPQLLPTAITTSPTAATWCASGTASGHGSARAPAGRARHSAAGGLGRWRAWSARLHLQGRDCVLEPRAEGLLGRQLAADGREQHLRLRVLRLVHRRQALQRLAPARVVGGLARAAQVVRLLARHWCCWELAEATGKRPRQQSCPVSLGCLRKGLLLLSCCLLARVWGGYAGCTDFISDGARSGAALQHRRRLKLSAAGRLTAATVDGSCFRDTLGSAGLKWDTLAREGCQAQSVAGTTSASTSAHLACQYPHALCDCCTPVAARSCAHSPPTWSGALRLRAPRRLASLHWPVTGATLASEGARSLREEAPRDDGQCPFAEAGAQLAGACACAGRCPSAPSPVRLRSGRG